MGLKRKYRLLAGLTFLICFMLMTGCSLYEIKEDGEDLAYDICDETMLPEELLSVITMKKEEPFNLTYSNNTYTYIVVCAGRQDRQDVGVVVESVQESENAICVETVLKQVVKPQERVTQADELTEGPADLTEAVTEMITEAATETLEGIDTGETGEASDDTATGETGEASDDTDTGETGEALDDTITGEASEGDTELLTENSESRTVTYPYTVIRIPKTELPVIFK